MSAAHHLNVLQNDGSSNAFLFGDYRTELVWNDDFTAFRAVALRWWDDASYARYQAGDVDDREEPTLQVVTSEGGCSELQWVAYGAPIVRATCVGAPRAEDLFGRCESIIPF